MCMPVPLSRNSGLGMNVTVLPYFLATFLMMYLYFSTLSAIRTSGANRMSISPWPAVATSWCWASTSMPHSIIVSIISVRMSVKAIGRRHGEVAFLVADLVAEVRLLVAAAVPGAFDAVEEVVAGVLVESKRTSSKMKNSASGPKKQVSAMPVVFM